MTWTILVSKITGFVKRLCRSTFSPARILWVLIIALAVGVAIISSVWKLETAQIVSVSMAALAVPLAFMTQRAILRENQKMTLRQQAYTDLQKQLEILRDTLITFSASSLGRQGAVIEQSIEIREATASLTYTYHTHEMVLIKIDRYFKFFHFSLLELAQKIDDVAGLGSINGYGDTEYDEKAGALLLFHEAKEEANDLKSYLYDFQKEIIEELGFSKLFGVIVERRKPRLKKYKTLPQVATKRAVRALEKKFEDSGSGSMQTTATQKERK